MLMIYPNLNVALPGLPPSVLPIEAKTFTYRCGKRKTTLYQFPIILVYVIIDYKCQDLTFDRACVDLKRPPWGFASAVSAYVQLSRCRTLNQLSILRPFDPSELMTKLPKDLCDELEWEEEIDRTTHLMYGSF